MHVYYLFHLTVNYICVYNYYIMVIRNYCETIGRQIILPDVQSYNKIQLLPINSS